MTQNSDFKNFIRDASLLCKIPTSNKYNKLVLHEFPFDRHLLSLSSLYRESRKLYLSLGGIYHARVSSNLRSLSAQDLFKDEIDFTPSWSELLWFKDHFSEVAETDAETAALLHFNQSSIYHEQNHRVLWRLLPPPPQEERDFCRYLNFAESLVVTLDLALGDQLGKKLSPAFERMNVIYRPGGQDQWHQESKKVYRQYLLSILASTYYVLEMINPEDILKAVDYVLPHQKKMNRAAVKRGLELNEFFTRITNPQWQSLNWKTALSKLNALHAKSKEDSLYMPEDPLDLEDEFSLAHRIFDYYGL